MMAESLQTARDAVNGNVPLFMEIVLCLAILLIIAMFYACKSETVRSVMKWAGIASMFAAVAFGGGVYLLFFH